MNARKQMSLFFGSLFLLLSTASAGSLPPGLSWNWNLEQGIPSGADIIDYDPKLGRGTKTKVTRNGAKYVICYFSAGSYEKGRPDMGGLKMGVDFKNPLKGGNEGGSWKAGGEPERWVNIDSKAVRDVMVGRITDAKERGCDGVEPDNLDGDLSGDNQSGFGKSKAQILAFYKFLSDEAHKTPSIMIGLKNSTSLVPSAVGMFDFVVVEECFKNNECAAYKPFTDAKKAVLIAEYANYSENCNKVKGVDPLFSLTIFPADRMVKNGKPCK